MIWKIAKKEFLLNLMTFTFATGTILSVALVFVFVPILAQDYQQRLEAYNQNVAANEAQLRNVRVYKNILPTVYRPPNVLSIFSEGVEKRLGASAKISRADAPEIGTAVDDVNPYMSMFPALDISLVLRIVFGAMALLAAYSVVSGEREQGTLKLILSGTTSRPQVLLGKLLAGLMTMIVPVTLVFILGLILLLHYPMIELSASDWVGIGVMYVASLVFIAAMYNLGLLFSALMKRSAISLILGLFAWIIFVVVVPSGSIYLATQIHPVESREKLDAQRGSAMQEYRARLINETARFPQWRGPKSDAAGAFGQEYTVACTPSCLRDASEAYPLVGAIETRYGDSLWKIELSYIQSLLKQKHLAGNMARISPASVYDSAMSIIARSDLGSFEAFMERARAYRSRTMEYVGSRTDDFSLPCYFTTCTRDDGMVYARMLQQFEQAQDGAARQKTQEALMQWIAAKKRTAEASHLDLRDFPRFAYRPGAAESLKRAIGDLSLLVIMNIVLFALAFVAFMKYDVRSD